MISKEDLTKIITDCKQLGYEEIRVRDIAFVILSRQLAGPAAYQCFFGTAEGYEEYSSSKMVADITKYMTENNFVTDEASGITFEENRLEMQRLLAKTQRALDDGTIEPKDAYKIMADIRVKLNDKFNVQQTEKERTIIVEKKFNMVCEKFHCECYLPTKEDLMEMYNLVEKEE